MENKDFHFNYDVTGVRGVKRKEQQTLDKYILKPDEWKRTNGKVNFTFTRKPMTVYKYTRSLGEFKSSVSSKKLRKHEGNRETAIGHVSRGVKCPFSGDHSDRIAKRSCHYSVDHSDRISKRSCHDSVKLVTPDGEAKKLCSCRTASSMKYLSKFMTPLFREEMRRVQIELKTAKEKLKVKNSLIERNRELIVKKSLTERNRELIVEKSLIERNWESNRNILKRSILCSQLKQAKDKARYEPSDIFNPNRKLLEGHDEIYHKKLEIYHKKLDLERRKKLAASIEQMKESALQKNLARIKEMKHNYYDAAASYTHYSPCLYWTLDTETEDSDSDDYYIDYDHYTVEKIFPPEMVEIENMSVHEDPEDDKITFLNYFKIHNRTVMPVPSHTSWYISTPVFAELDTE